jgi:uncharacterized protein YyaL (SSP411 family)
MITTRNNLQDSKSPYLQQHASNPVYWQIWSQELMNEAVKKDKLIIVSIGYSACHWCHVMETEVFEHQDAASVMNTNFVSIKVDREERPDIDEIYMRALQLMNGQGGWPLNVVCLPNGRPIWGATYVPKERWMEVLQQLNHMYEQEREQVLTYADQLTEGIKQSMLINPVRSPLQLLGKDLNKLFDSWQKRFDTEEGGANRAPKFPMPVNWNFLLEYGIASSNEQALKQVELTLDKLAMGGIYDQIKGGFARYSVDAQWKVPHFEKMLYDNAQLLSLYSKAHRHFKKDLYLQTIRQTWDFLSTEMLDESGAWYAALDADSEGEEGKFYVWQADELQSIIPTSDWAIFASYYSINTHGLWEKGNYILLRKETDQSICKKFTLEPELLQHKKEQWHRLLLSQRQNRVRPGLDTKALTSWNALMITAGCESYRATGEEKYLRSAQKTAQWILDSQRKTEASLWHAWQSGEGHIEGLSEDYAFSIEAFIHLFQCSGKASYLQQAKLWTEYMIVEFEDSESGLFYTRPKTGEELISFSLESHDNVMPSANSVMAHNLHRLGLIYGNTAWTEQAFQNLGHLKAQTLDSGESYANWARLGLYFCYPFFEITIIGPKAKEYQLELTKTLNPLEMEIYSATESKLAPFKERWHPSKTRIFPCQEGSCLLPYDNVIAFRV